MSEYEIVSKTKYQDMVDFFVKALLLRVLGTVKNSIIGLTFIYGGVVWVLNLPGLSGLPKIMAYFAAGVLVLLPMLTPIILFQSKLIIDGKKMWVQFRRLKFYNTNIDNIECIYRTNRFNGSYRVIYKNDSFGKSFFNIFTDNLPEDLKVFLASEEETI